MRLTSQQAEDLKRRKPGLFPRTEAHISAAEQWNRDMQSAIPAKRIRQNSKPLMNKLEEEYFERLKRHWPESCIFPQSIRFKLGNGIWYKPDFVVFGCLSGLSVKAHEVKGPHAFRGGLENLKIAAHQYPKIDWKLVWKDESGNWQQQDILS